MKKLMFATALVASAAAFADPLNAISFESDDYASPQWATNLSAKADKPDPGSSDSGTYFLYEQSEGGSSDSSIVTNVGAAFTEKYAAYYEGKTNYKFLALDTEGGTLWRSINELEGNNDELGTAKIVAGTGTYLDTLVQFTVTEDEAPTTTASDKLAIWLGVSTNAQGEVTGTNLMVRAGYLDDNGSDSFVTPTDFTLSTAAPIEAGRWYRLTIKTIGDVTACVAKNSSEYASGYMGFEIYLDGVQLAATEATISTAYMEVATGSDEYAWLDQTTDADFITYLQSNKVFPSLQGKVAAYALQGVGFQGTGAVDEIVWTDDNPFSASGIEFVLTWDEKVTAVSYVLSADMATTNTLTSGTAATIAAGTTGTIELIPTFASGFEFDYVDMGGAQLGLTFAVPTESTNATLVAKAEAPAYPTYVGSDTTLQGQYNTWKTTYGADSESAYEKQFLLNVASSTTVADDALQIDSITENATAGWDIVVSTTVTGAALSDGSTTTYNGYLLVKAADTLAGLATATPVAYPVTAVTGGKVSITVTSGKFMKVELTTTAPAQN